MTTNSSAILETARHIFQNPQCGLDGAKVCLRLWVDPSGDSGPPWPKPYFRGLDQLVFAGFDTQNSLLVDLRSRRVIGRFSPAMGGDRAYWRTVIYPVLVTILGPSIGITEVHSACVVRNGQGLFLAGDSGSGKSTLSLALTQRGFSFLSDDRTYISWRDDQLIAWCLPRHIKLRLNALEAFPDLAGLQPVVALNGKRAYQVDPGHQLGLPSCLRCQPRWVIFLERQAAPGFALHEIPRREAAYRLQADLLPEEPDAVKLQSETIQKLVEKGCWVLRHGGSPQAIAEGLAHFCEDMGKAEAVSSEGC